MHPTGVRLLNRNSCHREPWRNGGGWTEVLATGGHPDGFDWRASIARIDSDGPFSAFPGIGRQLVLLQGKGLELATGRADLRADRHLQVLEFPGEPAPLCRLLAGPVEVFNFMCRREYLTARLSARPLVGSMILLPGAGTWFVHLLNGEAVASRGQERWPLATGDTLIAGHRHGDGRLALDGAGEVITVHLQDAREAGAPGGESQAIPRS